MYAAFHFLRLSLHVYRSGEKIRQLLLTHGSFEKVEMAVKQWHEERKKNTQEGGYHTKQWLMDNRSFSK